MIFLRAKRKLLFFLFFLFFLQEEAGIQSKYSSFEPPDSLPRHVGHFRFLAQSLANTALLALQKRK